ncbi:MAG TPA: VanZ family protein [Mycobacteriales bacterium]|nr:VanZ family protein [Mycobacteriales bacterium]
MIIRRGSFALCVLLSFVVLFSPGSDVPGAPAGVDKIVHFSLFVLLALTGRWAGVRAVPLGLGLVCYAVVSEFVQSYAPISRDGSPADAFADTLGLLAALGFAAVARRRARPPTPSGDGQAR